MPRLLRVLLIGSMVVLAGACLGSLASEAVSSSSAASPESERNHSGRAAGSSSGRGAADASSFSVRRFDAGLGRADRTALDHLAADDAGSTDEDMDAGSSAFGQAILRDCTETLQCMPERTSNVRQCVNAVSKALAAATPEARQRFQAIVMRCGALRGCRYVDCVGAGR